MMRRWFILICCTLISCVVFAQEGDLAVDEVVTVNRLDAYGVEQPFADGRLRNNSALAYTNVNLLAEAYDSGGNLVGDGLGFIVNACGEALLQDFALQPGMSAQFEIPLDMIEAEATIDRVEVTAEGETTDPAPTPDQTSFEHITRVSDAEVVAVEWMDGALLRYSPGCWRDVFTNRPWIEYNMASGESQSIEHPRAGEITPLMLELTELTDPLIYNRSFFSFASGQRRGIYQTALNTLITTEPDGSFRRVVFETLFNITLQGINWHKDSGTFLAYYHGGYGDEVLYLVGNANGDTFSQHAYASLPSRIVPGFAANGQGVVIAATVEDVTGYFLKQTSNDFTIPMFQAEPPGNNWPAPFYEITESGDRWIYIARPVEGEARLQCYNANTGMLHDYTALPLNLATDERGWMWLSPDNTTLALAANGVHGGLWLVDLSAFPPCD